MEGGMRVLRPINEDDMSSSCWHLLRLLVINR